MSGKSLEISIIFEEIDNRQHGREQRIEKKLDFIIKLLAVSKMEWYDWGIEDLFPEMKDLQEKMKE